VVGIIYFATISEPSLGIQLKLGDKLVEDPDDDAIENIPVPVAGEAFKVDEKHHLSPDMCLYWSQ
jgi:hypothetical protein